MTAFLELLQMSIITLVTVFFNPFFWLVVFLVYLQYKRIHKMSIKVIGKNSISPKKMTISSMKAGIIGGIIGTILMMSVGITVNVKDFYYIFPLAILLMLINIRYICFSYSGGLLSLFSLIVGFPKMNVPSIIGIIAILHLIESILIYVDGHEEAVPIFLEDKKYGIIGGFTLQRFWPIPFIVLIFASGILEGSTEINLPDWWPLFKGNMNLENVTLQMAVVVAALGYGDIAISSVPKDKCKASSKRLFLYSTILLIISMISTKIEIFQWIGAIFSPLAHEYLIIYGQREEKTKTPMFRRHSRGVTILYRKDGGVGHKIGLNPGDVIVKLNSHWVNDQEEIKEILKGFPPFIWMEVIEPLGKIKTLEYKDYQRGIKSLDIVMIPKDTSFVFDIETSSCLLKKMIHFVRKKIKK
ncbi:MAG: hypothetical protein N4A62_00695 [Marinisporobacter sp.]|nr:hypothetical protein [Marinisporobacter sp.]